MMNIEQALSSCRAIFAHTLSSPLLLLGAYVLFVLFPTVILTASVLKTHSKIRQLEAQKLPVLPKKLRKILKKHTLDRKQFVVSQEKTLFAVSAGFFFQKIYFSSALIQALSPKQLEAVVLHESYHAKKFHAFWLLLLDITTKVFFFFPLLHDVQTYVKFYFEKTADNHAVSFQNTATHVKASLKKIIFSQTDFGALPQFSYQVIEQRIESLNRKKTSGFLSIHRVTSTLVALLVFLSFFFLNQRYAMAVVVEETITCNLFACVQTCVSYELQKELPMSQVNYSFDLQ